MALTRSVFATHPLRPSPRLLPALATAATATGLLGAVTALIVTAAAGSARVGLPAASPELAALRLDPLSLALVSAIFLIGLIVQSFTQRYAFDHPRRSSLHALALLATVTAALTATAGSVLVFALGWICTTAALLALLSPAGGSPGAASTIGASRAALIAADASLIAGIAVTAAVLGGSVALPLSEANARELAEADVAGITSAGTVAALLLTLAAIGRCAQIPFGAWITQTLTVPTPVSALLHAGIVSAGGLLVIAFATLITSSTSAIVLLATVAGLSLLASTARMTVRPDVKGALALSTRGQMGFMLLQCALGAFAAAAFHLIAHGMYKAALFLGAGGVVDEARALRGTPTGLTPPRGRRALRSALFAIGAPAVLLALVVLLIDPGLGDDPGAGLLLAFAWATAAQTAWWWTWRAEPGIGATARLLLFLVAAIGVYVSLLSAFKDLVEPHLPLAGTATAPAWALVPILVIALAFTAGHWAASAGVRPRSGPASRLLLALYARALTSGGWPRRRAATAGAPTSARALPTRIPGSATDRRAAA